MFISKLSLRDFRSWKKLELTLNKGVNIFLAPNGSGKTNLVEALYFTSTLQSHRNSDFKQLINFSANQAQVQVQVNNLDREVTFGVNLDKVEGKKYSINGNYLKRQGDYLGFFRTVIFSPEDLQIIKGEPLLRRKFLDEILLVSKPEFSELKKNYEKVLKQKNSLLKQYFSSVNQENFTSTLKVWNEKLADYGANIIFYRLNLIAELAETISNNYTTISTKENILSLEYKSTFDIPALNLPDLKKAFLAALDSNYSEETKRGTSLIGPHRDDFLLKLGSNPIKFYASQGETWSAAIALKLAVKKVHQQAGFNPIIILDDVFSELDLERRKRLVNLLLDVEQVIVTTAVAADIPGELALTKYEVCLVEKGGQSESQISAIG